MDLAQLQTIVAQGESETLEFKTTTGQRSEAMHDLCAMLNHRGGRVFFGVEPQGKIVGQQVSERTLEEIAQEIRQIEPPVFPQIDGVDVKPGAQVVVVNELKSDLQRLRSLGLIRQTGKGRGTALFLAEG
jgi:ATP-dependent DNA helicase RecG